MNSAGRNEIDTGEEFIDQQFPSIGIFFGATFESPAREFFAPQDSAMFTVISGREFRAVFMYGVAIVGLKRVIRSAAHHRGHGRIWREASDAGAALGQNGVVNRTELVGRPAHRPHCMIGIIQMKNFVK